MKNRDDFHCRTKLGTKLTLFAVSKDEWDTKEDTGNSMKNVCSVVCQIAPPGLKRRQTAKDQHVA